MIYLASPYTAKRIVDGDVECFDEKIETCRYEANIIITSHYMKQGIPIYSPVTHCHNLKQQLHTWKHGDWMKYCLHMLRRASGLYVINLPGYDTSAGVKIEMEFAAEHGIPATLQDIKDLIPTTLWEACCG